MCNVDVGSINGPTSSRSIKLTRFEIGGIGGPHPADKGDDLDWMMVDDA